MKTLMAPSRSQFLRSAVTPASLLILAVGVFLLLSTVPASAQGTASQAACRQIRATLLQKYVAYSRHDANGYLSLYAPDYVMILPTGKPVTYASFRKSIFRAFPKPVIPPDRPYWAEYRIQRCDLAGDNATVDAFITIGCPIYRPNSRQIAYYSYGDGHVTDLWQKTAHGWVIKHRKEIYYHAERLKQNIPHLHRVP